MIRLQNSMGDIVISNEVLERIVGAAATSCYGVSGMSHRSTTDGLVSILKGDSLNKGVKVTMADEKLSIDLHIVVLYGINIKAITQSIMNKIRYNVEQVTGLEVADVTVYIDGMKV